MDDRNGPALFDEGPPDLLQNIQMIPVLLHSLVNVKPDVAEEAAKTLRKILERADREFLRNNYATVMESLKRALADNPKEFEYQLFTDLIYCVHSLAKAVGEEGFKKDSAEIIKAMQGPWPMLPYFRSQLLVVSSLCKLANGNASVGHIQELKKRLRDWSIDVLKSRLTMFSDLEEEVADELAVVIQQSKVNDDHAIQASLSLLMSVKDKEEKLRSVWTPFWGALLDKIDRYSPNDIDRKDVFKWEKLMSHMLAIKEGISIVGEFLAEAEVEGMVPMMKEKLKWAIGIYMKIRHLSNPDRYDIRAKADAENFVNCIIDFVYEAVKAKKEPMCQIVQPITDILYTGRFYNAMSPSHLLRLSALLIKEARDHAYNIYREAINGMMKLAFTYVKPQEEVQEAAWTLGAMTRSQNGWRDDALKFVEDLEYYKLIGGEDEKSMKKTEIGIYGLVCCLSVVTDEERRANHDYDDIISDIVRKWVPINASTEAFETVYSCLATLIEKPDPAIEIDRNEDRLLLIIGSALSKEGIWEGQKMIDLKARLKTIAKSLGRRAIRKRIAIRQ